jgi:hypothetical protein
MRSPKDFDVWPLATIANNAAEWIVYDALFAYCQEMVKRGKPNEGFNDTV